MPHERNISHMKPRHLNTHFTTKFGVFLKVEVELLSPPLVLWSVSCYLFVCLADIQGHTSTCTCAQLCAPFTDGSFGLFHSDCGEHAKKCSNVPTKGNRTKRLLISKHEGKQCRVQNASKMGALQVLFVSKDVHSTCSLELEVAQNVCLLFIYLELFCSHYQSK